MFSILWTLRVKLRREMSELSRVTSREWIETDGAGGFASGTENLAPTRRYHALLLASTSRLERFVLVNSIDATLETTAGKFSLSSFRYLPDTIWPDGASRIETFDAEPWPRWTFRTEDGTRVASDVFVSRRARATVVRFRKIEGATARLSIRPLISGRRFHTLHHENPAFRFEPEWRGDLLRFRPYDGVPPISIESNGAYRHEPVWYRQFLYTEERARGLDFVEDLASPGVIEFDLDQSPAAIILSVADAPGAADGAAAFAEGLETGEILRRGKFSSRFERAADDFVVERDDARTIIAGYPWFADWGRDTFVSLRGLLLATGRVEEARKILLSWSEYVSEGMLPNRFPGESAAPEYNSVDASLWFIVAVGDFLDSAGRDREKLATACEAILEGYSRGTRFQIAADSDGLLAAGEPGVQLTWMDTPSTPRIGKPVEIEALWVNALQIGTGFSSRWREPAERAEKSFATRFWNPGRGCLYDVIDCDHVAGRLDASLRPNQILAVGGLPLPLLKGARARAVVDAVEQNLWTPAGLRSLSADDAAYVGRYLGGPGERDAAYHQGTVWPYLAGPFVDAWCRVRGSTPGVLKEARQRFVAPLLELLGTPDSGHLPEIADGDPPHEPRGCRFQAWSLGEILRLDLPL